MKFPPNPCCPMCERPVTSVVYQKHCKRPVIASVVYFHDDERHFAIYEPGGNTKGYGLTHRESLPSS